MKVVITNVVPDGKLYHYEPIPVKDWDDAVDVAMSYALMEVDTPETDIEIKSIERVDIPKLTGDRCRTCGEEDCVMICAACGDPVCYDCAKHSNVLNEPICATCKIIEGR